MNLGEALENEVTKKIASFFRPVSHADVVVTCPPVWVRASGAEFFFGLKRNFLNQWVVDGKVEARKAEQLVLYKFSDIEKAIKTLRKVVKSSPTPEDENGVKVLPQDRTGV